MILHHLLQDKTLVTFSAFVLAKSGIDMQRLVHDQLFRRSNDFIANEAFQEGFDVFVVFRNGFVGGKSDLVPLNVMSPYGQFFVVTTRTKHAIVKLSRIFEAAAI